MRWVRPAEDADGCRECGRARDLWVELETGVAPGATRGGCGREAAEKVGNRLWVAEGAEESLDARASDAGEEVLEIEPEDGSAGSVRCGEGKDGTAFAEAVHGGMERDRLEDFREDLALDAAQALPGDFEQADAAVGFGKEASGVVAEKGDWGGGVAVLQVGEPEEMLGVEAEPVGEVARIVEREMSAGCRKGPHTRRGGYERGWAEAVLVDETAERGMGEKLLFEGPKARAWLGRGPRDGVGGEALEGLWARFGAKAGSQDCEVGSRGGICVEESAGEGEIVASVAGPGLQRMLQRV